MKRKWWISVLLTLILGGTGYLYSGYPRRFLIFAGISLSGFATLEFVGFRLGTNPLIILAILLTSTIILFLMLINSGIVAHRQDNFTPKWYNKWWIYLLAGATLLGIQAPTYDQKLTAIQSYNIHSSSMAPALMVGDYFLADTYAYENQQPARGDIVVFKHPTTSDSDWVKRVIGLPGDKIQFVRGHVFINGNPLQQELKNHPITQLDHFNRGKVYLETIMPGRSYYTISFMDVDYPGPDNTDVYLVPKGHYFVAGDNRDNSIDSRFPEALGFVPEKNIHAKLKIIFWAKDWSRIGTVLNDWLD